MKVLLTAGTWDLNNGRKSGLIDKMYNLLKTKYDIDYFNGGHYNDLNKIIETAKNYDVIFWIANVPNELPKVRDVKKINPTALVIGSKRNYYDYTKCDMEYTFVEVLNKTLLQRNNLTIEFLRLKDEINFKMLLFDALGTTWYEGYDINELVSNMVNRIDFVLTTRREKTYQVAGETSPIDNEEFYQYVRDVAKIFHKTIEHADGVTRFLGNASFRDKNGIYVTKRDVDKSKIDKYNFVKSYLENEKVYYYGNHKPSKDTVVQVRLYKMFPNINYIVHSHCYAEGGFFTQTPVPCGALDEIDEIMDVINKDYDGNMILNYYKINLKGHGCLILGNSLSDMKQTKYITRHLPEILK